MTLCGRVPRRSDAVSIASALDIIVSTALKYYDAVGGIMILLAMTYAGN